MKNKIKPIKAYCVIFEGENTKLNDYIFKTKTQAIQFLNKCDGKVIPVLVTPLSITSKAK